MDMTKWVSTAAAAERCGELLDELLERSEYLEACRDFYHTADGVERASNVAAIQRAAARDTLPRGRKSDNGASQRLKRKGSHRVVLPGVTGPVRTPAWRHFATTSFSPNYSFVEVTTPDCAVESRKIAGTCVRPTGPPAMTLVCFGESAKVNQWIQAQRKPQAEAATLSAVWAYYRSCGIEAGPAAFATVGRLPLYACCIPCREFVGPTGCVNGQCVARNDCTWLSDKVAEAVPTVKQHLAAIRSSSARSSP